MSMRPVVETSLARPALEGAGVHLHRVFGFGDTSQFDPFLMMDDFRNDIPAHYQRGFPWHPHRGIETVTYVLAGEVEHADSLGNKGVLGPGSVQWMTAGSGILHQEMPKGDSLGRMHGFQLWANLPAAQKLTNPRYQDIGGQDIPEVIDDDGTRIRVVVGAFWGRKGPVDGIAANPLVLDVSVPAGVSKTLPIDTRAQAFAYVFEGAGRFEDAAAPVGIQVEKECQGQELTMRDQSGNRTLVRFGAGDAVAVQAGELGVRFMLVAGRPFREPVAWHGPIVMNTQAELQQAMRDLRTGNFIRHKPGHA